MGFFGNLVSGIGNAVTGGISSVVGNVVGNAVGNLFGLESDAEKANNLSALLTRETNAQNYQIWQEQKQHEINMWEMQNAYNDPSAQVERLRNAGLNPYLALQNGASTGMATSAPGSGQAPTMQTPSVQLGPNAFLQSLQSMRDITASQLAMSESKLANLNSKRVDTLLPLEESALLSNIDYTRSLKSSEDEKREVYRQESERLFEQNSLARMTYSDNLAVSKQHRLQSEAQTALLGLDVEQRSFVSKYFEPQAWINFVSSVQNLANMAASGELTNSEVKFRLKQIEELNSKIALNWQQYNINKPAETEAGMLNDVMNSETGIYGTSADGKFLQGSGQTYKQMFGTLTRTLFINQLQSAFNFSISNELNKNMLAVRRDQFGNYLKGRNFVRDWTGSTGTAITDYFGFQIGQDLDVLGNFVPFLGYGKGQKINDRNYHYSVSY